MALELKPWGSNFFLLEELGAGGMGMVYLGYHRPNKQLVAIKTLFPEMAADEALVLRFQRESQVYRKLNHPNIIQYVDSGVVTGRHFIALEFAHGNPLDETLKNKGAFPVNFACEYFEALVSAVAHAHEKEIVHRDLKPQNIIVSHDGVLKLLDFGIAQASDEQLKTVSGSILGTYFYSSPEQNQGKKVDHRSDIYSLGLIFFEFLTGKRCLSGGDLMQVTLMQMKGQIPKASATKEGVSTDFDKIIEKCTARDPNQRYGSCNELLAELRAAKSDTRAMGGAAGNAEVQEKWEQARAALLKKDLDAALRLATEVAEKVKGDAEVHALLGKVYQERKMLSQALNEFKQAVKLAPDDPSHQINMGIALFNNKMPDKAKAMFKQVLKKDSLNVYAKNYLAKIIEWEKKTGGLQPAEAPKKPEPPKKGPAPAK